MKLLESNTYISALRKINVDGLREKTIVISGATGMIGSCMVDALMQNAALLGDFHVIAMGRSAERAKDRFQAYWNDQHFTFVQADVTQSICGLPERVDYIIHAASHADPVSFAQDPVGTLLANIHGTDQLLRFGVKHGMRRFLYVSSGEMYGQPDAEMNDFTEGYCGPVDHSKARACYPAGKRAAEVLCQSYISQYQADAVIVRPCHVFGPTMTRRDSRAVSEFLWHAADRQDIALKSAGLVERSHCYVLDAVEAIFAVLIKGVCGEAYNIADRRYQMTIRDFAQRVASAGGCNVVFENPSDVEIKGYSKVSRAVLDPAKLETLGWKRRGTEASAIEETIHILREANR